MISQLKYYLPEHNELFEGKELKKLDIVHKKGRDIHYIHKELKEWGTKKEMERYKNKPKEWKPIFRPHEEPLDYWSQEEIRRSKHMKKDPMNIIGDYEQIGTRIGKLVDKKNKAYGDSFNKSGAVLTTLYPDGIKPEQYTDILCIIRILDKLFRIASQKEAFGESPYGDIAGYGILGVKKDEDET